eukprot:gb/GECG01003354.1/.p1 GENE.gb/GECG01003354.1/~~gb/GECG01003354.1/.p1  ORF type:complete len:122 (+),score=9.64 gb/GECG01003354.1/:1-366(+)
MNWRLAGTVAAGAASAALWYAVSSFDQYAAVVSILNSGADPHEQSWFNFGYWKDVEIRGSPEEFPRAAAALARLMYDAAKIGQSSTNPEVIIGTLGYTEGTTSRVAVFMILLPGRRGNWRW